MTSRLSILIPVYNQDCRRQVDALHRQAEAIRGLDYEIVVADDGSTQPQYTALCRDIARLSHVRFIERAENVGRAAIRNLLAREAQYDWLLFIDGDMDIFPHFIANYLNATIASVAYGGYTVGRGSATSLRYAYEKQCEPHHRAEERRKHPYQHFHTCNVYVRRDVMLQHPFDERFRRYGYEDVLWGKTLRQAGIEIAHPDNPVGFCTFEPNASFVAKTEEGLRTLHDFRDELREYSQIVALADRLRSGIVSRGLRIWHRLFGPMERRNLCGRHPSLAIFKLYKIGYFLSLTKNNKSL